MKTLPQSHFRGYGWTWSFTLLLLQTPSTLQTFGFQQGRCFQLIAAKSLNSTLLIPGHVYTWTCIHSSNCTFRESTVWKDFKFVFSWEYKVQGVGADMPLEHRLLFVELDVKCHPRGHMSEIWSSAGYCSYRLCSLWNVGAQLEEVGHLGGRPWGLYNTARLLASGLLSASWFKQI